MDTDDKFTYAIYSSGSPETLKLFEIESWSGILRLKGELDREVMHQHELILVVADSRLSRSDPNLVGCSLIPSIDFDMDPSPSYYSQCSHRSFTRVMINVLDVNDHRPEFALNFMEASVVQTAAIGTSIIQLTASDLDTDDNALLTYSIVSGNEKSFFAINRELGYIYIANSLSTTSNQGGEAEYFLRVKVSDSGNPPLSTSAIVRITLLSPSNMNPVFHQKQNLFQISENTKIGTIIGSVNATSNQALFYELLASSFVSKDFSSSLSTSLLPSENDLADEDAENSDDDDDDENEEEESKQDARQYFAINVNTGEIYLRRKLDYETCRKYEFSVIAINLSGDNDTASVVINIMDVNDNPPKWLESEYIGKISESSLAPHIITNLESNPLVVKAVDLDSFKNGEIRYEINEKYAKEYFNIDSNTGAITLRNSVDYERWKEISFTVSAFDLGTPVSLKAKSDAHVTILIENVNDCPPSFDRQNYHAVILLPTYEDVQVIRLNASDCDSEMPSRLTQKHSHPHYHHHHFLPPKSKLKYLLLDNNDASKKFTINSTTGLITVVDPTTISESSYQLHASVSDGKYIAQTLIVIEGKRLPRSSLHFERAKFTGHIMENDSRQNRVIMHLPVIGAKIKEHLIFTILTSNAQSEMFDLVPTSGILRSKGLPLDREERSEYRLVVQVKSVFHPKRLDHCEVHILIDDINDNAPMFINRSYYFESNGKSWKDDAVGKVTAIDHDAGPNGYVSYSIISGDPRKLFTINSDTGYIYMSRVLDTTIDELNYDLVVSASDAGK